MVPHIVPCARDLDTTVTENGVPIAPQYADPEKPFSQHKHEIAPPWTLRFCGASFAGDEIDPVPSL
jgi:hypothetical protein